MAQHFRRQQVRKNLLEMYRDNALRSQSYKDVNRLHNFMALMTEIELNRLDEEKQASNQPDLFRFTELQEQEYRDYVAGATLRMMNAPRD